MVIVREEKTFKRKGENKNFENRASDISCYSCNINLSEQKNVIHDYFSINVRLSYKVLELTLKELITEDNNVKIMSKYEALLTSFILSNQMYFQYFLSF